MKKVLKVMMLLISLMAVPRAWALENGELDLTKKGNIDIILSDNNNNLVKDAEITIYKLADATIKNNNLTYKYDTSLSSCKQNIDKGILTNNELECVLTNNITKITKTTNSLGKVEFKDLDLGLYLIMQTNEVKDYSKIKPFLLGLPTIEEDKWVYSISGTPKVEIKSLFDLNVLKEWNVLSNKKTPDSIEVELLENGEVIDKVTLSKENNWTHIWEQLPKSDSYSIREVNVPAGFTATYRIEDNKIIVTNSEKLVQTGDMPWIYELLGVVGITFILVGIMLDRRKNYEK